MCPHDQNSLNRQCLLWELGLDTHRGTHSQVGPRDGKGEGGNTVGDQQASSRMDDSRIHDQKSQA